MAVSNKLNVGILYDPAIPFLVIQKTEVQTYVQQQIVNEYHTKHSLYYKIRHNKNSIINSRMDI